MYFDTQNVATDPTNHLASPGGSTRRVITGPGPRCDDGGALRGVKKFRTRCMRMCACGVQVSALQARRPFHGVGMFG
jgi:hypothetical protein